MVPGPPCDWSGARLRPARHDCQLPRPAPRRAGRAGPPRDLALPAGRRV